MYTDPPPPSHACPFPRPPSSPDDASTAPNNNYGTGKVTADVKYALVDVMDIDEKHGMIELMQQTSVLWSDSRLAFSEQNYKGLAKLRIQQDMIDFDISK